MTASSDTEELRQAWDDRVAALQSRLPSTLERAVAWIREPKRRLLRIVAGVLFIAGSVFSILPVFGLWMLPVGLALLADDVPILKAPAERCARWIERIFERIKTWWR